MSELNLMVFANFIVIIICYLNRGYGFDTRQRSHIIGFKLKFWKSTQEIQFSEDKRNERFMIAKKNYCIVNFLRTRFRQFHFEGDVNFYQSRCGNGQIFFGFSGEFLTEIVRCSYFIPEQRWTFVGFQEYDIEDAIVESRRFEFFEYSDGKATLKMIKHGDKFYSYAVKDKFMCDASFSDIDFKSHSYPIPKLKISNHCMKMTKLGTVNSENFWYESAFHLINNEHFKSDNKKGKKFVSGTPRPSVINVDYLYGGEAGFLASKVYPHVPVSQPDLDCGGVTRLRPGRSGDTDQAAWVGYYGSGNHMMRFLIEMATGMRTASGLEDNDGSFLRFNHHTTHWNQLRTLHRSSRSLSSTIANSNSRFENILSYGGRGVLLIRNPYKAIASWYRHLKQGVHSDTDFHVASQGGSDTIPNHHKTRLLHYNNFERFVLENIYIWRTVIEDWVRVGDILVVHYENIIEDKTTELKKILTFLDVEISVTRLKCVEYCKNDMYKRKVTTTDQSSPPYTDLLRKEVDKSMRYIDDLLVEFEHESLPFVKYDI